MPPENFIGPERKQFKKVNIENLKGFANINPMIARGDGTSARVFQVSLFSGENFCSKLVF